MTEHGDFPSFQRLWSTDLAHLPLLHLSLFPGIFYQLTEDGIGVDQVEILVLCGLVLGRIVDLGNLGGVYKLSVVSDQLDLVLVLCGGTTLESLSRFATPII
jgi:hypothetical protein